MKLTRKQLQIIPFLLLFAVTITNAQSSAQSREHLLMDFGLRFSFGHP